MDKSREAGRLAGELKKQFEQVNYQVATGALEIEFTVFMLNDAAQ